MHQAGVKRDVRAEGRLGSASRGLYRPVINDVYQVDAGGVADTPISAGEVFFIYQYALSLIGLAGTLGAVPPDYT
jgi:hypothetical protein